MYLFLFLLIWTIDYVLLVLHAFYDYEHKHLFDMSIVFYIKPIVNS